MQAHLTSRGFPCASVHAVGERYERLGWRLNARSSQWSADSVPELGCRTKPAFRLREIGLVGMPDVRAVASSVDSASSVGLSLIRVRAPRYIHYLRGAQPTQSSHGPYRPSSHRMVVVDSSTGELRAAQSWSAGVFDPNARFGTAPSASDGRRRWR